MQSVAVFLALFAAASAGGLNGFGYSTGVAHHGVAVAQPALAVAGPVGYAGHGLGYAGHGLGYAGHGVGVAHGIGHVGYAAPIARAVAVAPAAQSFAFNNRAPAARVAIAAPVAYAAPVAHVGVAHHGLAYGAGPAIGYSGLSGLNYGGPAFGAVRAF